ncbi:hypothetical protein CIRMBP1314_00761 [Enterococcus cecorum]|nr:hypothetical protein CIRMBP1314_00761 [Enterococcus cecorum]
MIFTKTLKDIDIGENYPIRKYRYSFQQQIQFNKYLTKAVHQLDHYIYWYDPSVLKTTSGWADESTIVRNNQLDLDGKGTFVGKSVLKAMTKVDFGPPEEVIIHEKIGHTPEDLSVHPLIVSPLEEFFYEINLENRTKQTSKPYAFYNILPHKGDTMNDQDRIIDRGSTDGAIFKKIAQSDPDFDVYYSEVQDIQKLTTANWQPLTDSVDASRVKSIKVVLKKEMQANTVKKLLIQMRASHNPANLLSHNSSLLTQEGKTFLLDSNEVKTVVEEEPEPTPTEPEDKPDEPEPMPTEPEDKPDEPGVPNTAERENDDRFFMNSGGGKFDNQKHSTQGTVKQKELTRVAKSNTKKHLPATGMQKNGYLWLSVISLGLAGIVIYFDRRSRWHR